MLRKFLGLGLLAGLVYAVWRTIEANRTAGDEVGWEPQPFPFPPQPRQRDGNGATAEGDGSANAKPQAAKPWVDPVDGACPVSHPVKAKLGSGIYHVPGGVSYDRTVPDRCYASAGAAESDGLRASKR
jgi:hypothetical protein